MKRKPKALSVPVVVPDLMLDAKRAEKKRLYQTGGGWVEKMTTSAEAGGSKKGFRIFSSLINSECTNFEVCQTRKVDGDRIMLTKPQLNAGSSYVQWISKSCTSSKGNDPFRYLEHLSINAISSNAHVCSCRVV